MVYHLPPPKCLPTAVPTTSKGLLLGMRSLVPLNMLDSPDVSGHVSVDVDRSEVDRMSTVVR
jgi:hypothetical protein